MINTVIVDDEAVDIDFLKNRLNRSTADINVIAEFNTLQDAKTGLPSLNYQLLFLDIQLDSGQTAFDLLDHFQGDLPPLIFVTSHEKFALQALRTNAIDYLLKPVDTTELTAALAKYRHNKLNVAAIPDFRSEYHLTKFNLLDITEAGSISYLPIEDILYLSSDVNYTTIHYISENGEIKTITSTKNLGYYQYLLHNSGFMRIHQSYLVNGRHVRKILKASSKIFLEENIELPIARDRKQDVIRSMSMRV